jgi:hypothetical protein
MASAEFGIGEGFGYEWAATLRSLYEVFAALTNSEAIIPLLSGYEEHLSGFFG